MKKLLGNLILTVMLAVVMVGCGTSDDKKEVDHSKYPEKDITLIVPWAAGGITDTVARSFAIPFEKAIGRPVTVLNLPGASGAIGTEEAYSKAADGYTILFSAETPGIFNVMGMSNLSFDDFEAVKMVIQDTKVIVVPANSKYDTMEDLVEDMKQNPGKVKMSYTSPGASGHLQGLTLTEAGLDVNMIPFGGGNASMVAAISGEVEFTFGNYGTIKDYLESGELKALATFTGEQVEFLPTVPPMTEALPSLENIFPLYFPNVVLVKEGTPSEVVDVIETATEKALESEEWQKFVTNRNYEQLNSLSKEEISDYWEKYTSITSWLLQDSGAAVNNPSEFGIERYSK